MRLRLPRAFALLLAFMPFLVAYQPVQATHQTTQCKWDFPWPRQVGIYLFNNLYDTGVQPLQFSWWEMQRVGYGPATWSEANFNLYFRTSYSDQNVGWNTTNGQNAFSFMARANLPFPDSTAIAVTYIFDVNGNRVTPSAPCNRDAGTPVLYVYTYFNSSYGFYYDCKAYQQYCQENDLYDLHNTASHETGHWFVMNHSGEQSLFGCTGHGCDDTMFANSSIGEWSKRDLTADDRNAGWTMYGCRNGGTNYWC